MTKLRKLCYLLPLAFLQGACSDSAAPSAPSAPSGSEGADTGKSAPPARVTKDRKLVSPGGQAPAAP
jgi:hypothetical protein